VGWLLISSRDHRHRPPRVESPVGTGLERAIVSRMRAIETAKEAYDRFAPVYDEFNAGNNYEMWLGDLLLPRLRDHGLRRGWALDMGCGTGRAFEPLLARGWRVVGCDLSSAMLAQAVRKYGSRVSVLKADLRTLPSIAPSPGIEAGGAFELALMLNDVVNYMVEDGDLERVFAGVERNLRPDGGLLAFDANTLALFRKVFSSGVVEDVMERGWSWCGLSDDATAGAIHEARLSGRGVDPHIHRQRHWTTDEIIAALQMAGLNHLAAIGQREENGTIVLSDSPDETRDLKVIHFASRAD
jgi:SAM-dependent methyltransferase